MKLRAVCMRCHALNATLSQRLFDGRAVPRRSELIQMDATVTYEARCRDCHEVPD
jgi:thymidine kinase